MTTYEKPSMILVNETAEGVYAASGSAGGNIQYTLNETAAWDGNKNYDITITNNGESAPSASFTVNVNGSVSSITGNASGSVSGNTAVITFNNYGNGIESGRSYTFYVNVTGSGDFSLF